MAAVKFRVGQAGVFAAEQQCHLMAGTLRQGPRRAFARLQHRAGQRPLPRAGADHQAAAAQGLIQGIADGRRRQ